MQLIAQGFLQAIGINYNDTFTPTVQLETLWAPFHLTVAYGWSHGQDDVVAVFLHGDLDETIYMCQPEGYNDGTGHVARLLCSIYRLKQATCVWNKLMHQKLIMVRYDQLTSDTAIYLCNHNGDITILVIYIDNVMSFGNTKPRLSKSQAELHKLLEMKEEDPNWVMGFKLIKNCKEATVSIDHSLYINAVLCQFGMDDCNTTCTPLDSGNVLSLHDCLQTDEERSKMCTIPYWELIGTLMWITVISQPDISFVATYLAHFNVNPGQTHWKAAKHILCYLKGTANY